MAKGASPKNGPPAGTPTIDQAWVHGPLKRSGAKVYLHLVRGPYDPERSPRAKAGTEGSDTLAIWRKELNKEATGPWKARILDLLRDGRPRTFNEIGVTLLDKTADVLLSTPPDKALWELVAEGKVEHTNHVPIYFRLRGGAEENPPAPPDAQLGISSNFRALVLRRETPESALVGKRSKKEMDEQVRRAYEQAYGAPVGEIWMFLHGGMGQKDVEAIVAHPVVGIGALATGKTGSYVGHSRVHKGAVATLGDDPESVVYGTAVRLRYDDVKKVRQHEEASLYRLEELRIVLQPGTVPGAPSAIPGTMEVRAVAIVPNSLTPGKASPAYVAKHAENLHTYWPKDLLAKLQKEGPPEPVVPPPGGRKIRRQSVPTKKAPPAKAGPRKRGAKEAAPAPVGKVDPATKLRDASSVVALVNGSKNSVATVLWALAHGADPEVVYLRGSCDAPVTISYVRRFAEALGLRFRTVADRETLPKEAVVLLGRRRGAKVEGNEIAPFAGEKDREVWSWLDLGRVRPHPAYVLGVGDPCVTAKELEKAAKKSEGTLEQAIAEGVVLLGDFPKQLVLFDEGEKREVRSA